MILNIRLAKDAVVTRNRILYIYDDGIIKVEKFALMRTAAREPATGKYNVSDGFWRSRSDGGRRRARTS